MNCALDVKHDEIVDAEYVKQVRKRLREQSRPLRNDGQYPASPST
jgi:hypothetical protein